MRIPSITMLYEKTKKVNEIRGSSLLSPAHGRVGARATSLSFPLSVPPPSEKIACGNEGEAEEGCGGIRQLANRLTRAEAKPRRLLVQSRTPKKSFVFLLEKKIGRAQIRKCEENFFAGWRALASGGGAERSNFAVRIFVKKSSDFVQQTPPY